MLGTGWLERIGQTPRAVVKVDLPCAGCGYNLRFQRAGGSCPECGLEVRHSLRRFADPDRVAGALRTLGRSYLTFYVLLPLACMLGSSAASKVIMGLVLGFGATFRLVAVQRLNHEQALSAHLALKTPLNWLSITSIGEAALLVAMLAVWLAGTLAGGSIGTVERTLMSASFFGWGAAACVGMMAAGRLGIRIARWLEWPIAGRELHAQQVPLVIQAASIVLGVTVIAAGAGWSVLAPTSMAGVTLLLITVSPAAVVPGLTAAGLSRLAMAVERERGDLDDVLDRDPSEGWSPRGEVGNEEIPLP
jgi:hypothetical protein